MNDNSCIKCSRIIKKSQRGKSKFCSSRCSMKHTEDCSDINKFALSYSKTNWTKYIDLWFYNEKEFTEWFKFNYAEFGIIELIYIREHFPDVKARMYTGEILNIELEYDAARFHQHVGRFGECDLVIAFIKSKGMEIIQGVPVVSILDIEFNSPSRRPRYETRQLSDFFRIKLDESSRRIVDLVARQNRHLPKVSD